MKKTRTRSKSASQKDFFESIDQALNCCVNIQTFAELLKNCEHADGLNPIAIAHAGSRVLDEAEILRDVLRNISRKPFFWRAERNLSD